MASSDKFPNAVSKVRFNFPAASLVSLIATSVFLKTRLALSFKDLMYSKIVATNLFLCYLYEKNDWPDYPGILPCSFLRISYRHVFNFFENAVRNTHCLFPHGSCLVVLSQSLYSVFRNTVVNFLTGFFNPPGWVCTLHVAHTSTDCVFYCMVFLWSSANQFLIVNSLTSILLSNIYAGDYFHRPFILRVACGSWGVEEWRYIQVLCGRYEATQWDEQNWGGLSKPLCDSTA